MRVLKQIIERKCVNIFFLIKITTLNKFSVYALRGIANVFVYIKLSLKTFSVKQAITVNFLT